MITLIAFGILVNLIVISLNIHRINENLRFIRNNTNSLGVHLDRIACALFNKPTYNELSHYISPVHNVPNGDEIKVKIGEEK